MHRKLVAFAFGLLLLSCNNSNTTKKNDTDPQSKNNNDTDTSANTVEINTGNIKLKDLSNSTNMKELIAQDWELDDDLFQLKGMDDNSNLVIPFRAFYISPDGSFSKNPRNTMDFGKWEYDDAKKTITFNYTSVSGKDVYKIVTLAADELQVRNAQLNTSTILKFVSSKKVNVDPTQEPFHISNNHWRISPKRPEAGAELKKRLKENVHFFIIYYQDAIAKNPDVVSFYGLPTCLRFYSGAINITKEEELNPEWIKCFYNKEQALKAYKIMDKVMDKRYTWPKDEKNWLKMDLSVLQQIYNNIDLIN